MKIQLLFSLILPVLLNSGTFAMDMDVGEGRYANPDPYKKPSSGFLQHFSVTRGCGHHNDDGSELPALYFALEKDPETNGSEPYQETEQEETSSKKKWPEQNWGIAAGLRVARIPFDTEDNTVTNFIPQLFYEDDLIFLNGLEGGIKIVTADKWQLNALARLRFFDIPKSFQNEVQEDTIDLGLQLRYFPNEDIFVDLEILSDMDYQFHTNLRAGLELEQGALECIPYLNFDFKSADYNDYYYGLDIDNVGEGVDISVGIKAEYHLVSNLYLVGSFQLTWLDHNARHSAFVDKNVLDETFLGIKFSNERKKNGKKRFETHPTGASAMVGPRPPISGRSSAAILKTINTTTSSHLFSMDIPSPMNSSVCPLMFI